MIQIRQQLSASVPLERAGERVDKVLAELFPDHSRSSIQKWLKQGLVLLDDEVPRQRDRVSGGEHVELMIPEAPSVEWQPQELDLDLLYQDQHLLVINKPAGLVVHPGAGNLEGTLLNGLLALDPELARLPRAGIVHRLDKDTSGLMVVARSETARLDLIEQLSRRDVGRVYLALVSGKMIAGGSIDEPIGRDPRDRRRMVVTARGKAALTDYRIAEKFRAHTLVRAELQTGRTHQIRVHLSYIGFPLIGDPVYGERLKIPPACAPELTAALRAFSRQALHAQQLRLVHPASGKVMEWQVPMPDDMQQLVELLREDRERHG